MSDIEHHRIHGGREASDTDHFVGSPHPTWRGMRPHLAHAGLVPAEKFEFPQLVSIFAVKLELASSGVNNFTNLSFYFMAHERGFRSFE
jgi:hypothetical protein